MRSPAADWELSAPRLAATFIGKEKNAKKKTGVWKEFGGDKR